MWLCMKLWIRGLSVGNSFVRGVDPKLQGQADVAPAWREREMVQNGVRMFVK